MVDRKKSVRSRLRTACLQFLIPTARFLLRGGMSCAEFVELTRLAFVEAAASDYGLRGREANHSRIAAVTGLSRREVSRLKATLGDYTDDPANSLSPISDLLQKWHTDQLYLDNDGKAKALATDGESPSLKELVGEVMPDFPVRAMRAELLRSGVVVETSEGRLMPVSRQAVPSVAEEKLLASLSFNLRALVSTIAHNSNPDRREPGRIERFVNGPKLNEANRDIARARIRQLITEYSITIDDELRELDAAQSESSATDRRVGVGFFYYED